MEEREEVKEYTIGKRRMDVRKRGINVLRDGKGEWM